MSQERREWMALVAELREQLAEAEAERDREKERRIHWQGLAYTGMRVVDAVLNNQIQLGEGTTEESMQVNARMAIDKWNFIKAENAALREAAKAAGGCDASNHH